MKIVMPGKDVGGSSEVEVGQLPLVAEESDEDASNDGEQTCSAICDPSDDTEHPHSSGM